MVATPCTPDILIHAKPCTASALFCLQYIAPEVLKGQPQSKAADIFSLGMVMWEVCTRQEPYGDTQSWHTSKQADM
jgi:serine/threonine protein kinase